MAKKGKAKVEQITPDALQTLINKRFGAGTMLKASDPALEIERISSGILSIDMLLGGGLPRGRHIEVYGPASVGKNYFAFKVIATTQDWGGRAAFVDVEKSFDPAFAGAIGVDLDELAIHRQVHGARCVDFMETILRSRLYDVLVLDSIASLLPLADYENDMEAGSYGMEQAKLMSKALRKLTAANDRTVVIFINQTREAVGVTFGKKTLAPGGRAMAHYAGIRLDMTRTELLKRKGDVTNPSTGEITRQDIPYGHRVLVRAEKDKTGSIERPNAETTFVFNYEKSHHDHIEDLIYLGRVHGFVHKKKSGNTDRWWVEDYEDEAQVGRPKFKKWLRKNRAVADELEELIRATAEEDDGEEEDSEDD